jgi:hypothetical protein
LVLFGFMPYSCWANRPCINKRQFDDKPLLDFSGGPCAKNSTRYQTSPGTVLKDHAWYFAQLGFFSRLKVLQVSFMKFSFPKICPSKSSNLTCAGSRYYTEPLDPVMASISLLSWCRMMSTMSAWKSLWDPVANSGHVEVAFCSPVFCVWCVWQRWFWWASSPTQKE